MHEIELKFQVPRAASAAVQRAVAAGRSETLRMQAHYFDTPDRRLAAAGIALRLRKEGRRWVQTLKTRGDGLMQRVEHEAAVAGSRVPQLDLSRHDGTPAVALLAQALRDGGATLGEIFATDIRRTRRRLRTREGAVVELAFDQGEIRAGTARLPVRELEFELLRGPAAALPQLAGRWVQRHGLWLDVRSKAERGDTLARAAGAVPAVKAQAPQLDRGMSAGAALRAMLASALNQILANACELCDAAGTPEHLHQCRIGMRRMRCALRDFAALAQDIDPAKATAWQERLKVLFGRLGGARDRDALNETLLPALAAAGAPVATLPPANGDDEDPGAVMREPATNLLWLAILAEIHQSSSAVPEADSATPPLREMLAGRLRRLHRQVARDAPAFATLDEAAQHRTRKRLKRLRYGVEFCGALFAPRAVADYLAILRPAQDALGEANDLIVARSLFQAQLDRDPRIWFALGWLAQRRLVVVAQCGEALARIGDAPRFWRHDRRA
jgi:inorganic triphosphatase YgiF